MTPSAIRLPRLSTSASAGTRDIRKRLECGDCGRKYALNSRITHCEACGGDWFDAHYDFQELAPVWRKTLTQRPFNSMWRYRELLPVRREENIVSMGEGGTSLIHCTNRNRLMSGRPAGP